jgi:hypothetical protein
MGATDILSERLDPAEYEALLRADFAGFAERCFHELNPRTDFATNWHVRVIAAKLTGVHQGKIRRLIINKTHRIEKRNIFSTQRCKSYRFARRRSPGAQKN